MQYAVHNMPSFEQLNWREMGFMFWRVLMNKTKSGEWLSSIFLTNTPKDIVNLVQATRNHPSIVMWSSGNEVPSMGEAGVKR
jgi:beta-galactosidase